MTRFNFTILAVLLLGGVLVSGWVSRQIELRVLARVGQTTSLFAGSVFGPEVDLLLSGDQNEAPSRLDLNVLGADVVAFKIWGPGGRIIYSSNEPEVGEIYPVEEGLASAWSGVVSTEISLLDRDEHAGQREIASRLIETYAPIRRPGSGEIAAVIEFYQNVDRFESEIRSARRQTWAIVTGLVAAIYLGLLLLVRGGSRTIEQQREELERRVKETEQLLQRNTDLNTKLRAAARRTTTLNEEYLRRIAADLHDGPAQDIGYALLEIGKDAAGETRGEPTESLRRALDEIRAVSAGLRSPDLEPLPLRDVVNRALSLHRNRSRADVRCTIEELPASTHLAAKITIFRVLLEALSNARIHGGDRSPGVIVDTEAEFVVIRVSDTGPGIQATSRRGDDRRAHLGLDVMRERVELLGGDFTVRPNHPTGTIVEARIPYSYPEIEAEEVNRDGR